MFGSHEDPQNARGECFILFVRMGLLVSLSCRDRDPLTQNFGRLFPTIRTPRAIGSSGFVNAPVTQVLRVGCAPPAPGRPGGPGSVGGWRSELAADAAGAAARGAGRGSPSKWGSTPKILSHYVWVAQDRDVLTCPRQNQKLPPGWMRLPGRQPEPNRGSSELPATVPKAAGAYAPAGAT
jgi:hypothetical protein